jgi:hypothetical protein
MNTSAFISMSGKDLSLKMAEGYPVSPASIANSCYQGISLGLPGWVDRFAWKTFMKVFCREELGGEVRGWNVRLEQTGLEGPVRPRLRKGVVHSFGHFRVNSAESYRPPRPCASGVMLDYSSAGNRMGDPIQMVRDPLVSLQPDNGDWLLGWSYLDLKGFKISTPSYFLLRRLGALESVVSPPRQVFSNAGS